MQSNCTINTDHQQIMTIALTSNDVDEHLSSYKHLDDLEFYKKERLKQNATNKYKQIMHSIRPNKDEYDSADSRSDNEDNKSIDDNEDSVYFKKIIKRHKRRLMRNKMKKALAKDNCRRHLNHHHHLPLHHNHHLSYH